MLRRDAREPVEDVLRDDRARARGRARSAGCRAGGRRPSSGRPARSAPRARGRCATPRSGRARRGRSSALLAPCTATSTQSSSSSPFSMSRSARRSFSIMLGRTSASWRFWVPRVSDSTSTRSPPTASVSDLRSGIVVTTRTLSAPSAGGDSAGRDRGDERAESSVSAILSEQPSHGRRRSQNGCAGCAPRMNVAWKNSSSTCRALACSVENPTSWLRSVSL